MKWIHRCSFEWLKSRQNFLTATDVKSIIPVTKTGRARKITDADYLKVWSRKHTVLTEDNCISTGVMARGHILEPYAIDVFNNQHKYPKLYHWDDVIVSPGVIKYRLGFSPDAANVPQSQFANEIKYIGEVKSYSSEAHMACGCADKMSLEERWQLAVAMATVPEIEKAYLIFYNPSMPDYQMFVHEYSRIDLFDEINTVHAVENDWLNWIEKFTHEKHDGLFVKREIDPDEISIMEKMETVTRLNP